MRSARNTKSRFDLELILSTSSGHIFCRQIGPRKEPKQITCGITSNLQLDCSVHPNSLDHIRRARAQVQVSAITCNKRRTRYSERKTPPGCRCTSLNISLRLSLSNTWSLRFAIGRPCNDQTEPTISCGSVGLNTVFLCLPEKARARVCEGKKVRVDRDTVSLAVLRQEVLSTPAISL